MPPPYLDLNTIEVVELVVALLSCVVWLSTGLACRAFPAARPFLAAGALFSLGAAIKAVSPATPGGWDNVVARTAILLGLYILLWGLRRFLETKSDPRLIGTAFIFSLAIPFLFREPWQLREAISLAVQLLPILAIVATLLARWRAGIGVRLAAIGGMAIFVAISVSATMEGILWLGQAAGPFGAEQSYPRLVLVTGSLLVLFGVALTIVEKVLAAAAVEARLDDLTGISNRRDFMQQLQNTHRLAEERGSCYSVMIIDIDRFKRWNDGYGHATGDSALKHFTQIASHRLEPADLLARTGGDEFCLLMPRRNRAQAAALAGLLMETVRGETFRIGERDIALTVSIGIAAYEPGDTESEDGILANADTALYAAKNAGRDRYCVFDPATMAASVTSIPAPHFRVSREKPVTAEKLA